MALLYGVIVSVKFNYLLTMFLPDLGYQLLITRKTIHLKFIKKTTYNFCKYIFLSFCPDGLNAEESFFKKWTPYSKDQSQI